jgi:hypothetical protein
MKKALLLITIIVSFLYSADAQWNIKACGVTDIDNCTPEEFQCLWEKASKNFRGGKIATIVGSTCIVGGIIVYALAYTPSGDMGHVLIGGALVISGVIVDAIGIPKWKLGADRKAELKKHPHYDAQSFGTLNISPTIERNHLNSKYALGVTATLSF